MKTRLLMSGLWSQLQGRWRQGRSWFTRKLAALEPAPGTASWIRRVSLAALIAMGAWTGAMGLSQRYGVLFDVLIGVLIVLLMFVVATLIIRLAMGVTGFLRRYWTMTGLGVAGALVLLAMIYSMVPPFGIAVGFGLALALVLLGAGIGLLRQRPRRPLAAAVALLPALALLVAAAYWTTLDGFGDDPVAELVALPDHDGSQFAQLLEPGPYEVGYLSYGSGTDRWRPEFAEEADWQSQSVDARDMLGRPSGWRFDLRARWWGFGLDALPLNGRVWYPQDAPGDLPLVLVVHGNHDMMRFSDPGYAWIGEHLASRGHVVVSVDQNFLNGSVFGGINRENATRGWLLLRHLEAWREWRSSPQHPLHAQVDSDRVVLIGHSRGGEAVALAAAFNRLRHHPENAAITFDFDFGIQGIAAIAPVDGQFWPSGKPTALEDTSYFVLHGGYDGDVSLFMGDRQYLRTRPDMDQGRFSASLYLHHANHGQFNTVWGDSDIGGAARFMLNRSPMISGPEQRRAGLLYLTGFVETALARPDSIPPYFCDPRAAGRLLPATIYLTRCDDGRRTLLVDFEERLDVTQSSIPGLRLSGRELAEWKEDDVGFRGNTSRRQTGVFLGWHAAADDNELQPAYELTFDGNARAQLRPSSADVVWLDLAQADRSPPRATADNGEPEDQSSENDSADSNADDQDSPLRDPIRASIELIDIHGNRAVREMGDFTTLLPPLPVHHTRLAPVNKQRYSSTTEPLLQSVAIPLREFAADGVVIEELQTLRLRFDDSTEGVLIIERIALEQSMRRPLSAYPVETPDGIPIRPW
jgi:dienelactone hydrolase